MASTGVIGVELPMNLIRDYAPRINVRGGDDSAAASLEFAKAIMTTDTHPKQVAVQYDASDGHDSDGRRLCQRCAGMIHPNMATMLCFISTDADADGEFLQSVLSDAVTLSFNQIDIDGDQSTNDTVALIANGASGSPRVAGGDDDSAKFAEAVKFVNRYLAIELAREMAKGRRHLISAVVAEEHTRTKTLVRRHDRSQRRYSSEPPCTDATRTGVES